MARGTGTTLILHPTGRSDITFDQTAGEDGGLANGYVVPSGSLSFNEERRIEVVYGEGSFKEPVGTNEVLTDVTFDVIVSSTTVAGMLELMETLERGVHNAKGGTLEYKPEGLPAGVRSTFFHYIQSSIPARRQARWNRPDRGATGPGVHRMAMEIVLRTWPIATSDPDNLATVLGATTVYNVGDGTQDYVTIDGDSVPGSQPALARVLVTPSAAGAAQVGRLTLARRTDGLDTFSATLLSGSSVYVEEESAWSTVVDSDRCGGSYVRCIPAQNEIEYGRQWTIEDWEDFRGRAAVAIVSRSNAKDEGDWDLRYGWKLTDRTVYGKARHVNQIGEWEAILLGEFDLPDTEMSGMEDLDLVLGVFVRRHQGTSTLDIDAVKLLYTDEGSTVQVETVEGYGVGNTQKILIENVTREEVTHVVEASSSKMQHLLRAYGYLPTIVPGQDNRFDFVWERYRPEGFQDDFEDYRSLWKQVASFEDPEVWTGGTGVRYDDEGTYPGDNRVEGDGAIQVSLTGGAGTIFGTLPATVSLAEFEDGDYICLGFRQDYSGVPTGVSVTLTLYSVEGADEFHYTWTPDVFPYWQMLKIARSSFSETDNPTWASIVAVEVDVTFTGGTELEAYFDNLQCIKADPDAAVPNVTGVKWDGEALEHVGASEDANDHWLISEKGWIWPNVLSLYPADEVSFSDFTLAVKVWFEDAEYLALGVWFRATDLTASSEDGYYWDIVGTLDWSALAKFTAGSKSWISGTGSGQAPPKNQWTWIGVQGIGDTIRLFNGGTTLKTVFLEENMVQEVTDSTFAGTKYGLAVCSTGVRIAEFHLDPIKDLHVPADSVEVQVDALLRTIYPFYE